MNEYILAFEAEDVNDPMWDKIIKVLKDNIEGFEVRYADGEWMNFVIPSDMEE